MPKKPILIIESGAQRGNSFLLEEENTLGRDPSSSLHLPDPRISRNHCRIWRDKNDYKIADLKSKNGTYINNFLITETILHTDDIIQLGETRLRFHFKAEKPDLDVSLETADSKQTMVLSRLPSRQMQKLDPKLLTKLTQEKTIKDLTTLYHLSFSIYMIRNIDRLLTRVLELIFQAVPAERGVILLVDDQTRELYPRASRIKEGLPKSTIKISTTITKQSFLENIAVLTKDAQIDKRFDAKTSIVGEQIRSAMSIPISTVEDTFGLIYLDTKTASSAFNEDTLRLITAVANQVAIAIENIRFHDKMANKAATMHKELKEVYNMVGISKEIREVFHTISKVAPIDSTVLITGESGTGKELVARAIHYNSKRSDKPFICVNCTTLPETLIESELFGHEKGAFTGAHAAKPGQFELGNGGTVFLDEIGEMPLASQSKLLRVLEENKIRRVGGTKDIPVNVRVIAATNREMEEALKKGLIREDLFYRLKVISITLPQLKQRKDDIPLLAQYYLDKFKAKATHFIKGFTPEALTLMGKFSWPGNVRELKNCIERAVVMGKRDVIGAKDLDLIPQDTAAGEGGPIPTLAEVEKNHIHKVLNICQGNKTRTAEILGIRRSTLYEKLKLYELE